MKLTKYILLFFLLSFLQKGWSQSSVLFENSFTEKTTDQNKFSIYLDTIEKYLYRDINIAQLALDECQKIIDRKVPLNDSIQINYIISKIYFEYSKAKPLGAFQIIIDNEDITNRKGVSKKQIGNFNYLKSFTYMSIGDLEAAQTSYYKELEIAKRERDTAVITRNLLSLGQLYNEEKDTEAAIKNLNQAIKNNETFKIAPSTMVLIYIEISESYNTNQNHSKALEALHLANDIAVKEKLDVFESDILMMKSGVYLAQHKLDSAEHIYDQLKMAALGSMDENNIANSTRVLAEIYRSKKDYPKALEIYHQILENTDSTNLNDLMETYTNAHEVSMEMKKFESAYDYLLAYNKVKDKKDQDAKRQKTAYLKIKYESDQKEKDNAILAAKVTQNQAERKLLYWGIVLSLLFLTILFGAFYQKSRYSKKLEDTVLKRTVKLKRSNEMLNNSNQELDEFNRILSHDLKEPLRSIVGFSQLANRNILDTPKAQEYLDYVTQSGQQLKRLIDDVGDFRMISSINTKETTLNSFQTLLREIHFQIKEDHPGKTIQLECLTNPTIIGSTKILRPVFRSIIDNAAKYNTNKTVSIKINHQLKNQIHTFEIEDNGIGIAQEYHSQIFKMFKKLNTRDTFSGSGLGLSIAQKLLEKIDGKISILRSQENKGSTFLISFPAFTENQNTISGVETTLKNDFVL